MRWGDQGFVYLRGEYRYLLDRLNAVLARRRRESARREHPRHSRADFDIGSTSGPAPTFAASQR